MNQTMRTLFACLWVLPLTVAVFSAGAVRAAVKAAAEETVQTEEKTLPDQFTTLHENFSVSPQLSAADITAAAQDGYTLIVNNRPDGEMIGQPKSAELEAAANAAGIAYVHIPVDGRGISEGHISALKRALDETGGKTLAFCRSGTRSTILESYREAADGRDADDLIAEAAAAGYDISSHRPALDALKAGHQED